MKNTTLFSILVIITGVLNSCTESSVKEFIDKTLLGKSEKGNVKSIVYSYNIVLIADGTDIKHNEYAVPVITEEYLLQLIEKIQQHGRGKLWLGYIDKNSGNNPIAYMEIYQAPIFAEISGKARSETGTEYQERIKMGMKQNANDSIMFEKNKSQCTSIFLKEAKDILQSAYSEEVATARVGSDVNGAINAANRLLKTIPNDSITQNFIVLVSDGVDNIKNSLNEISDNVEILLINNSGSKCHLKIDVIELDNLARMEEYIFNKQTYK